jgi:hypothetical protein
VIVLEKIAVVIPKAFQKLGLHHKFRMEMIFYRWDEIVGAEIACHTRPMSMNHGLLFVAVNSSVWCHHLMMMKESLIKKLNHFAQSKVVTDIKYQTGSIQRQENSDEGEIELSLSAKIRSILLTKEEVAQIRQLTDSMETQELRQHVFSLLIKDCKLTKYKKDQHYHPCAKCRTLCPPHDTYCTICSIEARHMRIGEIYKVLKEAPWLQYRECKNFIECSAFEFRKARQQLILQMIREMEKTVPPPLVESTLVMLLTSTKPEFLNNDLIEKTMSKVRRKKNVFAYRQ